MLYVIIRTLISSSQSRLEVHVPWLEGPSQNWRTFFENHAKDIISIEFFTVWTATFRALFVFLTLANARRRVVQFNVTAAPSASWTALQIIEAFRWDTAPKFLLRDWGGT